MYTKGDWEQSANIIHCENGNICALADPRRLNFIGYHPLEIDSPDWQEAMDNGKLIKAAPALLAACEMAFEDLEQYEYTDLPGGYAVMETVQTLRAAIAAARGEALRPGSGYTGS